MCFPVSPYKKADLSKWIKKANFTDFFKTFFRDGKVAFYGLLEDHVNNWLSSRDLSSDSCKEIFRVAQFICSDLTPETVREIAEKNFFANIKNEI